MPLVFYRKTKSGIEILLQKRSKYVDRNALFWDVSAGGHVDYGEEKLDAAVREAREEIGANIDKSQLELLYTQRVPSNFRVIYLYDYTGAPDDFHFDDHEVAEVKWVNINDFKDFIDKNAKPPLKKDQYQVSQILDFLQKTGDFSPEE